MSLYATNYVRLLFGALHTGRTNLLSDVLDEGSVRITFNLNTVENYSYPLK